MMNEKDPHTNEDLTKTIEGGPVARRLKDALLDLLDMKHFDSITVVELCTAAKTSRVTFYTYYDDKFELLYDYFNDMLKEATADFTKLQSENNASGDPAQGYCNILDAIMNLYYSNLRFFRHAESDDDAALYFQYYWIVLRKIEQFTLESCNKLSPTFSVDSTSSFLCNGLWGFIHTGRTAHRPVEEIRKDAKEALKLMLNSGFFSRR